jgi:acetyl esterase/lipase/lysophospholipase L1-like esterase
MKRLWSGRLTIALLATVITVSGLEAADTVRIACIGNSITYGYGLPTQNDAYPRLLQQSLRTAYMTNWIPTITDTVFDWGVNSTTLQKKGDVPYWTSANFQPALKCRPAIVTIALGTNDTKSQNWNTTINSATQFPIDYLAMIDTFAHLATSPKIFAGFPPACSNNNTYGIKDSILSEYIIPRIQTVASQNNILVNNLYTPFLKHVNFTGTQVQSSFWEEGGDGVHPNDTGHRELADIFYESMVNSGYVTKPLIQSLTSMPFTIRFLWYGYAPHATGNDTLSKPMLYVFPAPESLNTGLAAVICPGGGYTQETADTEGFQVAAWLNQNGISAFVLRYRFSNNTNTAYYYPTPMLDVARAMRTVRYYASYYHLDTTKIGVIGFSAGGHLASWLETHYDHGNAASQDTVEQKKDQPNWCFLLYPMTTMLNPYVYAPGRTALLGNSPATAVEDTLSNSMWVTANTPPTFIDYGTADQVVDTQNSTQFDSALRAFNVPQKLMTDPGKPHGFGMAGIWPDTALAWLRGLGILSTTKVLSGSQKTEISSAPIYSVAVTATGLRFTSLSRNPTEFTVFSVSGKRCALFTVRGAGSFEWQPPSRGAYIVHASTGGAISTRTVTYDR